MIADYYSTKKSHGETSGLRSNGFDPKGHDRYDIRICVDEMKVKVMDVTLKKSKRDPQKDGKIRAEAVVYVGNNEVAIIIKGVKVIEKHDKSLTVSLPQRKIGSKSYENIVYVGDKNLFAEIQDKVLQQYNRVNRTGQEKSHDETFEVTKRR